MTTKAADTYGRPGRFVKTLGLLNPKVGVGQSGLVLDLGGVLADAGFRVGLVDFDPQAGLTERAACCTRC